MGAAWGELRVGPCSALTWTVPGLAGQVGCVRGQAIPCMEGAAGLSRRIFPKRKRPSGTLWGIPPQQQLQSPFRLAACLVFPRRCGGVSSPNPKHGMVGGGMHTSGGPETTGTDQGVYTPTRECTHLTTEGPETTGTGESENQGRP